MAGSRNRTVAGASASVKTVANDELIGTLHVDASEVDLGVQDRSISLSGAGSLEALRDSLNSQIAVDIKAPHFKNFADEMKFMDEKVLCRVYPSSDPDAEKIITVYNDGVPQRFVRNGQWQIVRRKYIEVLARSKPFGVSTPEVVDNDGYKTTRIQTSTALRYPFEMQDKNPKGQAWLTALLQEA